MLLMQDVLYECVNMPSDCKKNLCISFSSEAMADVKIKCGKCFFRDSTFEGILLHADSLHIMMF